MDSIAALLYSDFYCQDHLIAPLLRQIYNRYLRCFLDERKQLSFSYPCVVLKRLLYFFEPELQTHFSQIDFTCYPLVSWVMTLFAHTVQDPAIWTDLFCYPVDQVFFIAVAIFSQLSHKLVMMDLNELLGVIGNIGGLLDVGRMLRESRGFRERTPAGFIQSDLVPQEGNVSIELLSQNEYFALRWWELERIDYRPDIEVPLVSCEEMLAA